MYNTDLPTRAELPSTAKLLRSTIVAALIAAVLLVTAILPAEYGIDPLGTGRMLGLTEMGEIKVALAEEAHAEAVSQPAAAAETKSSAVATPAAVQQAATESVAGSDVPLREDVMTVKLKQGEATEIKLIMPKGARVNYEWSSSGGGVNYDTHGDPHGAPRDFYHGYGKGRNTPSDAGVLEAAFDGKHGWFWRNRSGSEVTITLKTKGEYTEIKKVL